MIVVPASTVVPEAGLIRGRGWFVSGPCWGRAISGKRRLRLSGEDAKAGHPLLNPSLAASSVVAG